MPPRDWVPAIRSLEDIANFPYQSRPGRTVVTCAPCDVEAWQAGIAALGLDVALVVTPDLEEGVALTWSAPWRGRPAAPNFDRYYREDKP